MRSPEEKLIRRGKWKRLSFINQFKIEFLLPFTGCRNVLKKMLERPQSVSWIVILFYHSLHYLLENLDYQNFLGSAVLLAANLLALFEEVIWVTASANLLTCYIWHLECSYWWVSIEEVKVFCKTSVKALNIALLLLMISPAAREFGVV